MSRRKHECEVVVVGTGAGGAVAGACLAECGRDTILLEEGQYFKREDHGRVLDGFTRMYRDGSATITLGKPPISLPLGRGVGGTTLINSSTCFRPPQNKVSAWGGPSYEELEPFFEEVERRIHARPADWDLLGGNGRVLKRGCDALGIEIKPLVHNIRDCQKRGQCQFGCPSGAKQSTEVSFVPSALQAGARLLTGHRVDRVIVEKDRAVGVQGKCQEGSFEIKAKRVVLSLGAILGPVFLLKQRLANSSGRIGRGLQIHPASRVVAEMDEIVDGHIGLSQGACIDHWKEHGIMMEGIFLHPGLLISFLPGVGRELKEIASAYRRLSAFGVFVDELSVGRIWVSRFLPGYAAFYNLHPQDALKLAFGIARIAEIYLAAGARRVFTGCHLQPVIDGRTSLARFETLPVRPTDLELGAFHPLGTCPMGEDPRTSAVHFSLETHDVKNLYIMDASVIPRSLGVNPQVTIMALAMRAARLLSRSMN